MRIKKHKTTKNAHIKHNFGVGNRNAHSQKQHVQQWTDVRQQNKQSAGVRFVARANYKQFSSEF